MSVADIDPVRADFQNQTQRNGIIVILIMVASDKQKAFHFLRCHFTVTAVNQIIIIRVFFPQLLQYLTVTVIISAEQYSDWCHILYSRREKMNAGAFISSPVFHRILRSAQ